MVFYRRGSSGTVTGPIKFNPEDACTRLFEGMEGLGTDEDAIVEVIASHTNEQRQVIKDTYKTMYGEELEQELKSELSGSFSQIVLALMKEPQEYIIESINQVISKKSMKIGQMVPRSIRQKLGLGADEFAIISLLCPRTNDELYELEKAYKQKYGKKMEDDFADDWDEDFRYLILGILNGDRDESEEISPLKIQEDVEALRGASKEQAFMQIFTQRSYAHMRALFYAYKDYNRGKKNIEELIECEFSRSMQAAYLAMVNIFRNVPAFYAERLNEALMGAGTDDDTLIRIVVSRSEIDLKEIMDIYEERYNATLLEDVVGDTSGDYKNILQKLLTPGKPRDIPVEDPGEGEESGSREEDEAVEEEVTTTDAEVVEAAADVDEYAPEDEEVYAEEGAQAEAAVETEEAKEMNDTKQDIAEHGKTEQLTEEGDEEETEEVNDGSEEDANKTGKEGDENAMETKEDVGEKTTTEEGCEEAKEEEAQGEATAQGQGGDDKTLEGEESDKNILEKAAAY